METTLPPAASEAASHLAHHPPWRPRAPSSQSGDTGLHPASSITIACCGHEEEEALRKHQHRAPAPSPLLLGQQQWGATSHPNVPAGQGVPRAPSPPGDEAPQQRPRKIPKPPGQASRAVSADKVAPQLSTTSHGCTTKGRREMGEGRSVSRAQPQQVTAVMVSTSMVSLSCFQREQN